MIMGFSPAEGGREKYFCVSFAHVRGFKNIFVCHLCMFWGLFKNVLCDFEIIEII